MTGVICPTYQSGFYSPDRGGRAKYPQLWRGCVGAWAPCIGPSGLRLQDNSGFGNHGTLTNMDAATDWVVSGGAWSFDLDGTDDTVRHTSPACLMQIVQYSMSAWVNVANLTNNMGVWSSGTSATFGDVYLRIRATSGLLQPFETTNGNLNPVGSNAVTVGIWTHLAMTRSNAYLRTYVNGKLDVDELNTAIVLSSAAGTAAIGAVVQGGGISSPFAGMIDDVRFYNRTLTQREVLLLATRRGIAYELDRRSKVKAPAAAPGGTSGNLLLLGVG